MNIDLIHGRFTRKEAEFLIRELIEVKIRFHESRIQTHAEEEDIKQSERRLKELHDMLSKAILAIRNDSSSHIDIQAHIRALIN